MIRSFSCIPTISILNLQHILGSLGQKYADQIDLRHYFNSTWVGFSWITFAVTILGLGASIIYVVFSQFPTLSDNQSSPQQIAPAWKTALISVVRSLIIVITALTLLWITVYKMDLESVHFGDEVMDRVHGIMSNISSVGYSTAPGLDEMSGSQEIVYSGYAMARGCYAGMGAILFLALVLRLVTVPHRLSSSKQACKLAGKPLAAKIVEDRDRTLFLPWMVLGVTTMLMILLSRRHNGALFAFFGIQLRTYLSWISLARRKLDSCEEQDLREDSTDVDYVVEEVTNGTSDADSTDNVQRILKSTKQTRRCSDQSLDLARSTALQLSFGLYRHSFSWATLTRSRLSTSRTPMLEFNRTIFSLRAY